MRSPFYGLQKTRGTWIPELFRITVSGDGNKSRLGIQWARGGGQESSFENFIRISIQLPNNVETSFEIGFRFNDMKPSLHSKK